MLRNFLIYYLINYLLRINRAKFCIGLYVFSKQKIINNERYDTNVNVMTNLKDMIIIRVTARMSIKE